MKDNIGQYQIKRILGRGGMGAVYLANDSLLDREVAIKTVQSHMDTSNDRFFQEARTLARLNHPNIASLYNLIQEDGETYMVMEYINGISLEDLINFHPTVKNDLHSNHTWVKSCPRTRDRP